MLFLVCGMILLLPGLFFLWLALRSRDPKKLVETVGDLSRRQHFRNMQIKSRRVKNLTEYTYSYTAGGKTYSLSGTGWIHPRELMRKCTVTYMKGFPRLAYIGAFTGIREWLMGASLLLIGVLCIWMSTQIL